MDKGQAYANLKAATEKMREAEKARIDAITASDDAVVEWAEARAKYYRTCGLE